MKLVWGRLWDELTEIVRPATVCEMPIHSANFSTVIDMRNDQHARCMMHMKIAVMYQCAHSWWRTSGIVKWIAHCTGEGSGEVKGDEV